MCKKIMLSKEVLDEVNKRYIAGESISSIAKSYNISNTTLSTKIKEAGIVKQLSNTEILRHSLDGADQLRDDICEYYKNNKVTYTEVANKFNIGITTVYKLINQRDIEKRMSFEYISYDIDETYFDNIDTINKAYILGLLYADGCISSNNNKVSIALEEHDVDILNSIREELKTDRPLFYIDYQKKGKKSKNQYMLSIENKHIHDSLIKAELLPQKSFTVKYPSFLTNNLDRAFIRGMFDGDGCFYYNQKKLAGTISFTSSGQMIQALSQKIEEYLNIHPNIHKAQNAVKDPQKNTMVLSFGGNKQVKRFLYWLYDDNGLRLNRKYQKYIQSYNINNSLLN